MCNDEREKERIIPSLVFSPCLNCSQEKQKPTNKTRIFHICCTPKILQNNVNVHKQLLYIITPQNKRPPPPKKKKKICFSKATRRAALNHQHPCQRMRLDIRIRRKNSVKKLRNIAICNLRFWNFSDLRFCYNFLWFFCGTCGENCDLEFCN